MASFGTSAFAEACIISVSYTHLDVYKRQLNIYIGNPALKQSFRHSFGTSFNFFNVLKERGMWTSVNFSMTDKAFVQSSNIDASGRRYYQTVNRDGHYNIKLYRDNNIKVKKVRLGAGSTTNIY